MMNAIRRQMLRTGMLLMLLQLALPAHAFYDPSLGRWINRDPVGEPGAKLLNTLEEKGLLEAKSRQASTMLATRRYSTPFLAILARDLSKFASPDAQAANLYGFLLNNPLDLADPFGLEPMLPPGWHGPGYPEYDPKANPFCGPPPPCFLEGAALAAAAGAVPFVCANIKGKSSPAQRTACAAVIIATMVALDKLTTCLSRNL